MNLKSRSSLFLLLFLLSIGTATGGNPYPVAGLKGGNVYLLPAPGQWQQLTKSGDVTSLCWLDSKTICFCRTVKTGLDFGFAWRGCDHISDLFTIALGDTEIHQLTINHFAAYPAPSPKPGQALFAKETPFDGMDADIWETDSRTFNQARALGIEGFQTDVSPDGRWVATLRDNGSAEYAGIGLYRYSSGKTYRIIYRESPAQGPFSNPRFSPDGKRLIYGVSSHYPDSSGLWYIDVPDGQSSPFLIQADFPHAFRSFGWTADGTGLVLLFYAKAEKTNEGWVDHNDLYYYELADKKLTRLNDANDFDRVTAWH